MPTPAPPEPQRRFALGVLARLGIVVVTLGAVTFLLLTVSWRRAPLTDRDPIIVTDFANTTGEPVFDRALRPALVIHVEQSPYFNVVPPDRIAETLRLMNRSPDEPVTEALGREICQRGPARALISGAIAKSGSAYALALRAARCDNGATLATAQVQASSREGVLDALSTASSSIRRDLGESIASIEQYDVQLRNATTGSLEALQAFSDGDSRSRVHEAEALPFFQRAIEVDPQFALAHARLSTIYSNIRDPQRALDHATRAYELKDRVTERERFYITARYLNEQGDLEALEPALRLWAATFPRMAAPRNNLAQMLMQTGRYDEALRPALDAVQVDPASASAYASLGAVYLALGRLQEAESIAQEGVRRVPHFPAGYVGLVAVAFMRDDQAAVDTWIETGKSKSTPAVMYETQARVAGATGQLQRMDGMAKQALAEPGSAETAAGARQIAAGAAISHAAFGDTAGAARWLASIGSGVSAIHGDDQGLALAAIGDARQVTALIAAGTQSPSRRTRDFLNPILTAALAVAAGDGGRALQAIETVSPGYRRRPEVIFFKAEASALAGQPREALSDYDRLIAVRGAVEPHVVITRAYLGRARALARLGDVEAARTAYDVFLRRCAQADDSLPVIDAARAEQRSLATASGTAR
jgi:eukaryotic-like serine/threonine-protein kinase